MGAGERGVGPTESIPDMGIEGGRGGFYREPEGS